MDVELLKLSTYVMLSKIFCGKWTWTNTGNCYLLFRRLTICELITKTGQDNI